MILVNEVLLTDFKERINEISITFFGVGRTSNHHRTTNPKCSRKD